MQKRAQFDDRIRNLIALAQDGSEHSRTLLFSHICDLFLQKRPMASAHQVRMLTEILNELLNQVDLHVRKEIATALSELTDPPEELINIMCEDVVEVSGPLLEKAILSDDKLIHIIRYGTEPHRIHISRRFGLSPLVRHELDKAYQESQSSKLKYSLTELDKQAEQYVPDLDEETTANILELLRAQKIHSKYDAPETVTTKTEAIIDTLEDVVTPEERGTPGLFHNITSKVIEAEPHIESDTKSADTAPKKTDTAPNISSGDFIHPRDTSLKDNPPGFPRDKVANDSALPESNINMPDPAPDLVDDISQQVQDAREETNRQREFVRSVADWFWEVDRSGLISFLSEEAFTVFGRPASDMVGEDFISLFSSRDNTSHTMAVSAHQNEATSQKSFEALIEHRSSFRDVPFYISSQQDDKTLWYISAIAIFDIHSGRFTGFRGSARSTHCDDHLQEPLPAFLTPDQEQPPRQQETALENFITSQAQQAVSLDMGNLKTVAPEPLDHDDTHKNYNEDVASELLQNLSHEFRTPLNAIIGFSEMIDMETWGPVNPQYHENTKNILAAAVQLKEAVNDVLDSAKLEAGLMQIEPESFSLKAVLKDCRDNVEIMARECDVTIEDNHNNIDVILYNDMQSVELCLTKMIASSLKRAKGGETLSPSVLINSNAQVRIEIPILGPRIDKKNKDELFQKLKTEPSNHENIAEHKKKNGFKYEPKISSGFGLSIAQGLAHLIGGDISVVTSNDFVTHLVLTLSNHEPSAKS